MPKMWGRMLLVPQLARLGARAPRDSNTAWEGYWSRISSTGRQGQVLWDADSTAEKERYAPLIRRHLDTTPYGYLRRVRLERAHRDLQAGSPADTSVAAVAGRWGFADLGRFAAQYRTAFGRLPSQTLRT